MWPILNTSYETLLLAYNIGYLFDRTPYYRPWLHWLGVDIRRMSEQDFVSVLRARSVWTMTDRVIVSGKRVLRKQACEANSCRQMPPADPLACCAYLPG